MNSSRITKSTTLILCLLLASVCNAQDLSVNVTNVDTVMTGVVTPVSVTICNTDPSPVDLIAGHVKVRIDLAAGLALDDIVGVSDSVLTGWEINHQNTENRSRIELINTHAIQNADCISFLVKIRADQSGVKLPVTAQLELAEAVKGNRYENDRSTSTITVIAANLAARLAVKQEPTQERVAYPNPVYQENKLRFLETKSSKVASVRILNTNGKLVYKKDGPVSEIDFTNFPPGVYVVDISLNNGQIEQHKISRQ